MAFDGLVTRAMVTELREKLLLGKINKIYQPVKEELVLNVYTRDGNYMLFASAASADPRVHLIDKSPANPPVPLAFCMLLRKHLTAGRIVAIEQKDCERVIEISLETVSELGFTLSKKLIFEIMGKHSNIILVDAQTGNIIDSIKRVSIDTSRVRQVLPGKRYEYPPAQDKVGFDAISEDALAALPQDRKAVLNAVGGISPALAAELAARQDRYAWLRALIEAAENGTARPHIYDLDGEHREYHIADLAEYETGCERIDYPTLSACVNAYFEGKAATGRVRQQAGQLEKHTASLLDKARLKKQRLEEDLLAAEDSEYLRIYGELLTANIHNVKPGASSVKVLNYYDGTEAEIPLDPRFSAAKNAQQYFKRYGKSRTALKEKAIQIEENDADIAYLESVLTYLEHTERPEEIEALRAELEEGGYVRRRKEKGRKKNFKAQPYRYTSPSGFQILAGRNNRENDELTLKTAGKTDLWFHTKDIPGSHVILLLKGAEPAPEDIYCAASVAAWHNKGRASANVPVDYVPVRYVKKPSGAKPGMVIFTNNRTVYVDPKLPEGAK